MELFQRRKRWVFNLRGEKDGFFIFGAKKMGFLSSGDIFRGGKGLFCHRGIFLGGKGAFLSSGDIFRGERGFFVIGGYF